MLHYVYPTLLLVVSVYLVVVLRIVPLRLWASFARLHGVLCYPDYLARFALEGHNDMLRYGWERERTEGV